MKDTTNYCSRCGAELKDLKIHVSLNINVDRLKTTDVWEEIPNLDQVSKDVLCESCFDSFASILEKMNVTEDAKEQGKITQQQLDPLHRLSSNEEIEAEKDRLRRVEPSRPQHGQDVSQIDPTLGNISPERQKELDRAYEERMEGAGTPLPSNPSNPIDLVKVRKDCNYA